MEPPIVFRLLGPLKIGSTQSLAPKPRALLAMLLLNANRSVSREQLASELWDERPPRSWNSNLRTYAGLVRAALGSDGLADRLRTQASAYILRVRPHELDVLRFRHLCGQGRTASERGDLATAAEHFQQAYAMWRGAALQGVPAGSILRAGKQTLDEERVTVLEDYVDACLGLGRHDEALRHLVTAAAEHPLRERFHAQLMLALYRTGRTREALATFRTLRQALSDELGVEPNSSVQRLHRQILASDPALDLTGDHAAAGLASAPLHGARGLSATGLSATGHGMTGLAETGHGATGHGTTGLGATGPGVTESVNAGRPSYGAPAQLPADVPDFVGRAAELHQLDHAYAEFEAGSAVGIVVLAGAGGLGKSALAVRWGCRNAWRFPGGQFYVDLRGSDPHREVAPLDVLAALLRSLGVAADHVPADASEAAALYRSLLAATPAMVLLDDAADAAQVLPLVPSCPGSMVLVTSRVELHELAVRCGARRIVVAGLARDEAADLLARMLGPERVAAHGEIVADLLDAPVHTPLALRHAAAMLAATTDRALTARSVTARQLPHDGAGPLD